MVTPPAPRCGAVKKTSKYGSVLCQALRARMPEGTHAARCARHLGDADRARLATARTPQTR